MFWYYEMKMLHVVLVSASVLLFFARGVGLLAGARWPMDDRVRTLGGGLDFLLTMVGLSLWGLLALNPMYYPWVASKMLLLLAYIGFANLMFRWAHSFEARLLGFVLALLCLGLMVQVSLTKDALGGF